MTYTYAICGVSQSVFDEIKAVFEKHGYHDQIDNNGRTLNMHGIALEVMTKCPLCFGPLPCLEHKLPRTP